MTGQAWHSHEATWVATKPNSVGYYLSAGFGRLLRVWWPMVDQKPAAVDNLYIALAAIWQPPPTDCWGWRIGSSLAWTTSNLHGQQQAVAGCWGVAHGKLAGVNELYNALATILQQAFAGGGG